MKLHHRLIISGVLTLCIFPYIVRAADSQHFHMRIGGKLELGTKERGRVDQSKWMFAPCDIKLNLQPFDSKAPESTEVCDPPRAESSSPQKDRGFTGVLSTVLYRGFLECGISTGVEGFAFTNAAGEWDGFDVQMCRAVAAAVLGNPLEVRFTPTTGKTRFTALASGEVDMLARNTTWTFSRDAEFKFEFVGVNYYDGQGFMVPKAFGVNSAKELDGATVCLQTGTTTELNLANFFRANNISYEPVPVETNAEAQAKYLAGACDVFTTDASGLAAIRATLDKPSDHIILPEMISKEPLGLMVREGDREWAEIVRWTLNALILAEEKGISAANVFDMAAEPAIDPEVNNLLGSSGEFGAKLGLDNGWAVRAISAVGNYGEVFDKYLGVRTAFGLPRGQNALWVDGGLMQSPPFR